METITISKEKYEKLKQEARVNHELLKDIVAGINDILNGKVKEI